MPAENQASFRMIRQHTTTPIAVGEVFNTIHDCAQLIEEELIDYIRMTVVHGGGISHLRKIAALAELHHVRTGSHGATDLSPVAMAAALHFDLSVHNFGIQEYMRHTDETDRGVPARLHVRERRDASGRRAGPRRRHRRSAGGDAIRTTRRTCRSTASWMGRCTHGDAPRVPDVASLVTVRLRRTLDVASGFRPDSSVGCSRTVEAASMRFGYAAITWGSALTQAMDDIAAVGFRGIQLRGEAFAQFGDRPAALKEAARSAPADVCRALERQPLDRSGARAGRAGDARAPRAVRARRRRAVPAGHRRASEGARDRRGRLPASRDAADRARQAHRRPRHPARLPPSHEQPRREAGRSRRGARRRRSQATCACCSTSRTISRAAAIRSRRSESIATGLRCCTSKTCRPAPPASPAPAVSLSVRRAGARTCRPAGRLRGAARDQVRGLGDRRARSRARSGRHAEGVSRDQQAVSGREDASDDLTRRP